MRMARVAASPDPEANAGGKGGGGGGNLAHMQGLEWDFAVIHSPTIITAIVAPDGGKVREYGVSRGAEAEGGGSLVPMRLWSWGAR